MYRFWDSVIEPLFDILEPDVVVEVGSDQGHNTKNLIHYCRRSGAKLHVVDPLPKYDADDWVAKNSDFMVFHRELSLSALGSFDTADAVLIDGDHNWYTVVNELRALERIAQGDARRFPVVILHDVGWPYGRRDLYYDPETIPPPDRQVYDTAGMRPGRSDLDPEGGLNPHLANATHEGGPRNGVLTAVEDFIEQSDIDMRLEIVPGINGLAILCSSLPVTENADLADFLGELTSSSRLRRVLEDVEHQRVIAMIDAGDSQNRLAVTRARFAIELNETRSSLSELEAELQRSRAHQDSLLRRLEVMEGDLERAKVEAKSQRRQRISLQKRLQASEQRYKRLLNRRSVRAALRIAAIAKPLLRPIKAAKGLTRRGGLNPAGDRERLVRRIVSLRPGSERTSGPLVSIIVLTRDGSSHLERLLPSLQQSRYGSFELVVVDNGSSDSTSDVLGVERSFPIHVIRNEHNASFSAGNNQGAVEAKGEYLLLLNNDVEPINRGWLGSMVDALESQEDAVACGALLVYPSRGDPDTDLTVQHAGTRFTFSKRGVRAINMARPDPLQEDLGRIVEVPAATAAALLVDRAAFDAVGGFTDGYVYGTEDVDLCLKLKDRGGRILVSGQAVLFHYESATQDTLSAELTRINRTGNRQMLMEHWGPRLTRSVQRDRLLGSRRWSEDRPRTVAITLTHDDITKGWGDYYTAHELGESFSREGWAVVYAERHQDRWYELTQDVDLVISLLDAFDVRRAPEGALTVAWVRNWVERWLERPWFEQFDVVATSSHASAKALARESRFDPPVISLATNLTRFAPGPSNPAFECDYAFTGNNWGVGRGVITLLDVRPDERFLLFGKGWDKDPRTHRYWRGHLDYNLLPELYRSAKIVLDDTAAPTLPHAFVNGRVFDALAAGALVISDNVDGSAEMFDGALPTYTGRQELRALLDHYLENEAERLELVTQLRAMVEANHSYPERPGEFVRLALEHVEQPKVAIKIGVPREEERNLWGDTHFADGLASGLTKLGMPTEVHLLPEWDLPQNQTVDIVIHLRGLSTYAPKPAHVNVLWIISHPEDISVAECEKYDLVLVASKSFAERLASQTSTPVVFMPQATDERRFHPVEPSEELSAEVLFVGNTRGQDRPAVKWAISSGLPLVVYGGGWSDEVRRDYVRADHYPNSDLARLYASGKVVLNDHWPDMREGGFISNRIFDVAASGAVVVSDRVAGLQDVFGDLVPTYEDADELERVVRELLADDDRRGRIALEGAKLVAESHTFTHRAAQLKDLLRPLLETRKMDLDGNNIVL